MTFPLTNTLKIGQDKNLVYNIALSKHVKKALKKIKNKQLANKYLDCIYKVIALEPESGTMKQGNLHDLYTQSFTYQKTNYRVAYTIKDDTLIIVILIGSHENFYKELRRKIFD